MKHKIGNIILISCISISLYILLDYIFTCNRWQSKELQIDPITTLAWVHESCLKIGIDLWSSDTYNWLILIIGALVKGFIHIQKKDRTCINSEQKAV